MGKALRNPGLLLAAVCLALFAATVPSLYERPRPQASPEMEVALPRFVQVLMAAGDRYLAANLAGFRALVVSTEQMSEENYRILGIVQKDLAWLNPAHEDNYYLAAAILPWNGEVDAAQAILQSATFARPFDWQPPFYYAFNALHFLKNPGEGAEWLRIASRQSRDEMEQLQLEQLAAQWVSRGQDRQFAIQLHRAMAKETKYRAFAKFLEKRAERLENQWLIEKAIGRFKESFGRPPASVDELVEHKLLDAIPADPFGSGYAIDPSGAVVTVRLGAGQTRRMQ